MRLRLKVFVIVIFVVAILFAGTFWVLLRTLEQDFSILEKSETAENAERVRDAFYGKVDELTTKLNDWSNWDDSYEFIRDRNEEYVESNLQNESLEALKIDFIIFVDDDGQVVFEKIIDTDGNEIGFPKDLETGIVGLLHADKDRSDGIRQNYQGVILTSEGPMVMAVQGVTSNDGEAPPKGLIAFGFSFDDIALGNLSSLTHSMISHSLYDEPSSDTVFELPKENLSKNNPIYVGEADNRKYISGFVFVSDIFDRPALVLRTQIDRHINEQKEKTIALFSKIIIPLAIFFTLIVLFLFEFLVLRRLSRLSGDIREISRSKDNSKRVFIYGKDELAQLGKDINKMLESLQSLDMQRRENEGRFHVLADNAPMLIWTADTTGGFTYVNKEFVRMTGKPLEDHMGNRWKNSVHPLDVEKFSAIFKESFKKRESFSLKYRLKSGNGTYRWVYVQAIPEMTLKGIFTGYLGCGVDITEIEEADVQRAEYINEIENMNKMMISRELKMISLKEELNKYKLKENG